MKNILLAFLLFIGISAHAQDENFEAKVKEISRKIERVTLREKTFLKDEIKEIKNRLENKEISKEEADRLKIAAAEKHAEAIEEKIETLREELEVLVENKANQEIESPKKSETIEEDVEFFFEKIVEKNHKKFGKHKKKHWKKEKNNSKRTTSQFVFAYGVNNVISNHQIKSLDHSDYKFWKSHFYELGGTYKTRISKKPSMAYVKYGFSFVWNLLRTEDNLYHVVNGDVTSLQVHAQDLSESKLRNVQFNFPVHLEFDFSKNKLGSNGAKTDRYHKALRIGLGGYVGANISTKQKLKYENDAGHKVKEYQKGDFNTSKLTYGLSSYISYKSVGLYAKYDLAPLFKDTEIRNVSMGIRFDFD